MRYISTRGGIKPINFKAAVMMGLATDGGLLLPEQIPTLTRDTINAWQSLSYQELAFNIISLFATDIPAYDLERLINRSYDNFDKKEITPVVKEDGTYILELFHGPTLAFKDVALQLLGNLFEYLLNESGDKMNIIGATSGDTGSAAIHGVRGKKNINIFILHPYLKTSSIQALQMTTVLDSNVHNVAVKGTFDDCQDIVKALFNDLPFKESHNLGAVNSINWARILAQIVYYFYAWFRVKEAGGNDIVFSIPTGNFGDIFAGYVAKRMGLPIGKLLLATNENNILTRFINDGDYSLGQVVSTVSPSMDIQVASNFERYLFYLLDEEPNRINKAFTELTQTGSMKFSAEQRQRVSNDFISSSVTQEETLETISRFHKKTGYLLDPHTAVGVKAALDKVKDDETTPVCLATAHPAKFSEAVQKATGISPPYPSTLAGITKLPTRCELLEADISAIKTFIVEKTQ